MAECRYELNEMRKLKNEQKLPCDRCNRPYDETKRGGYMDIHHIDGNPQNNYLANLRILCKSCHAIIHKAGIPLSLEHKQKISDSQKARHKRKNHGE